jgi:hypothetical protein
MLASLILGIAAGAGAPWAEPRLKSALENILQASVPTTAVELRVYSFAVCLFGAAILAAIFGDGGSVIALTLGALIGVFGPRIMDRVQGRRAPDYGPDPE